MAYTRNTWANGDIISSTKLNNIEDGVEEALGRPGISAAAKQALLTCFEKVAWIDGHGQDYYDDLEYALYPPPDSITVNYTQSGTVYDSNSLDDIKSDITVTAHYTDGGDEIIPAALCTLSGSLTVGISIITVSYRGESATFGVTVNDYRQRMSYAYSNGDLTKIDGTISNNDDDPYGAHIANSETTMGRRRVFAIGHGVTPLMASADDVTYTASDYYMIPVPSAATSCTYAITPNTQYAGAAFYTWDSDQNKFVRVTNVGWKQGSYTHTFVAGSVEFMSVSTKYNSSGTSYPTEPSEFTINFA